MEPKEINPIDKMNDRIAGAIRAMRRFCETGETDDLESIIDELDGYGYWLDRVSVDMGAGVERVVREAMMNAVRREFDAQER